MKYKKYCPECKIDRFFFYNIHPEWDYIDLPPKIQVSAVCNDCHYFDRDWAYLDRDVFLDMIEKERVRIRMAEEYKNRKVLVEKNVWNLWGLL